MAGSFARRRVLAVAGLAAIATVAPVMPRPSRATGLRRTIRIGTVNPPGSATGHACRAFAAAVAASPVLSPVLQVQVFTNGLLGGELEIPGPASTAASTWR